MAARSPGSHVLNVPLATPASRFAKRRLASNHRAFVSPHVWLDVGFACERRWACRYKPGHGLCPGWAKVFRACPAAAGGSGAGLDTGPSTGSQRSGRKECQSPEAGDDQRVKGDQVPHRRLKNILSAGRPPPRGVPAIRPGARCARARPSRFASDGHAGPAATQHPAVRMPLDVNDEPGCIQRSWSWARTVAGLAKRPTSTRWLSERCRTNSLSASRASRASGGSRWLNSGQATGLGFRVQRCSVCRP